MADLPANPIEIWASQDYVLPNTGQRNKKRPIDDLWLKGYDKGQKPSVEHFNYLFNLLTDWVTYLKDITGGLEDRFLPLNGTTLVFGGDLTGTAQWAGDKTTSVDVQVVDNSHGHISANITDATSAATPNRVAIRDNNGGIAFAGVTSRPVAAGNESFYALVDVNGAYRGGLAFNPVVNRTTIWTQAADGTPGAGVDCYSTYVQISNPRTSNAQEAQGNSLVRFDYLWGNLDNVNNSLAAINSRIDALKFSTLAAGNPSGWWRDDSTGFIYQWTTGPYMGYGQEQFHTINFPIPFPNSCMSVNLGTNLQTESSRADGFAQTCTWDNNGVRACIQWAGDSGAWETGIRATVWAVGN